MTESISGETNNRLTPIWWWGGLLLVAVAVFVARFRLIELPLERDEGEYAYGAQLLLHGGRLYDDLHTMKWPGLYAAYALIFSVAGESVAAIHGGLILVNLLTAVGVFLLARHFLERTSAYVATVCFLVLSVLPVMHGIIANAEHFAILFPVFGLWCLVHSLRERQWFGILIAGVLIGLGAVMKQHAHAFVALGGILTLLLPRPLPARTGPSNFAVNLGQSALYVAGVLAAWGGMCLAVWQRGDWDQFILWTIQYPQDYTRQVSWSEAIANFQFAGVSILKVTWPLVLLAFVGFASIIRQRKWEDCCVLIGLFVASLLSLCPGFYFREHYFLMAVPAFAILCGKGGESLFNATSRSGVAWKEVLTSAAVLVLLCVPLVTQGRLLFTDSTALVSRTLFGPNPFVESPQIAAFLNKRMSEEDRMVIFGSEPQIPFYAQRRLATGDIYMYPMTEIHPLAKPLQVEMIRKVNESQPKFALFVSAPTAWLTRPQTEQLLINWMPTFLKDYHLVGLVETVSMTESKYDFAAEGEILRRSINRIPSSTPYVAIFCRNNLR